MTKNKEYTGSNIDILDDIEAIRQRSGMYAGSLGGTALHMCREILDNSVDEFINGHATEINVEYDSKLNKVTIIDNGRGMPVDIHPKEGIPTIEVLVTKTHAGGKFSKDNYKASSGLNGVGCTVVNSLSSYFKVTSIRDGHQYSIEFSKGRKTSDFKKEKISSKYSYISHGTIIEFTPDPGVITQGRDKISVESLKDDLDIRSYTNGGLTLTFKKDGKDKKTYFQKEGILAYFKKIKTKALTIPFKFEGKDDNGNEYEVAFAYFSNSDDNIKSFVNGISLAKGIHETGYKAGFNQSIKAFMSDPKLKLIPKGIKIKDIKGEDISAGLYTIINLKMVDTPEFTGQTKDELSNEEVGNFIKQLSVSKVNEILYSNEKVFSTISKRIAEFAKGRIKASKFKENIIKSDNSSLTLKLSSKYSPCWGKDSSKNELFIIEGDSAGGATKSGRFPEFQAVYALKGKPLNVEDVEDAKVLANKELSELLTIIFGTNNIKSIKNFDYDKMKFDKIIMLTDADDDGYHIESLALTFFIKYTELIQRGFVYLALPPKYRYQENGKFIYLNNDKALHDFEYNKMKESLKIIGDEDGKVFRGLLDVKDDYIYSFDQLCNSQMMLTRELLSDISKDINVFEGGNLTSSDEDNYQGVYKGYWNDFSINEVSNGLTKLDNVLGNNRYLTLDLNYKGKEYKDLSIIDFFKFLDDNFKFKYGYFKGLGESNGDELRETTLDPKKRSLIKVKMSNVEKSKELSSSLFSKNKTDERKDIMRKYFSKR